MQCRKCNRVLRFDQSVTPSTVFRRERMISSYICPRCGHRDVAQLERWKRNIPPVNYDRRVAV